jgi:RNA polymerase sigma factor (sigma-70 family)
VPLPPFQSLLDAHRDGVYGLLVALVGRDAADDCFQETFVSALRAYPRLESARNLRGWLFAIARNKALDHLRARARVVPVAELDELVAPAAEPSDRALWPAVRALPPKQREAVALRFAADLAYADVGAAMGTSEEAARRNVHEALRRLREEITP